MKYFFVLYAKSGNVNDDYESGAYFSFAECEEVAQSLLNKWSKVYTDFKVFSF